MNNIINLDYHSRTPIYEQIVNSVERFVSLEILKPNDQIPSIRELASTLGINPNTVKKAYHELERRGVINTISTKGTFITEQIDEVINNKIKQNLSSIKKIASELQQLGLSKEEIINKIKEI